MRRLRLEEFEDRHLALLQIALEASFDVELDEWLEAIANGKLEAWEVPNGLLGFSRGDRIFVWFLAGKRVPAQLVLDWLKDEAGGKPIDGLVADQRLVRLYRRLGFRALATYVRYDHGLRSTKEADRANSGSGEYPGGRDEGAAGNANALLSGPLEQGLNSCRTNCE